MNGQITRSENFAQWLAKLAVEACVACFVVWAMVGLGLIASREDRDLDLLLACLGLAAIGVLSLFSAIGATLAAAASPAVLQRSDRRLRGIVVVAATLYPIWMAASAWAMRPIAQTGFCASLIVYGVVAFALPRLLIWIAMRTRFIVRAPSFVHCQTCGYPIPTFNSQCPECGS